MARVDGILPADFNEAQLVGELEDRETEYNGLVEALATRVNSGNTLEGKLYRNTAVADPKKVVNEKDDLPMNKMSGYALKFLKCRYAGSFCLTPSEREFGHGREQTISESIWMGKGREMDQNFMRVLCDPVVFCPTKESDGKEIVRNDFAFINPDNEGLTPEKLRRARDFLRGGNGGRVQPTLLSGFEALDNLSNFDEFKNFDCTYGKGSALWGDVSRYPEFQGLTFRQVENHVEYAMNGTDDILQTPVIPITPNYDADGNIDPDYEVHWVPLYDRATVGYEPWHELCISMQENLPNKLKKLLNIDFEYGYGLTRMRTKNVVWIGALVRKNECVEWKSNPYNRKFPTVTDGVVAA